VLCLVDQVLANVNRVDEEIIEEMIVLESKNYEKSECVLHKERERGK